MFRIFNVMVALVWSALALCLAPSARASVPPPAAVTTPGPAPAGMGSPDEDLVAAFYKLADAYERKGNREESVRYLKKVLDVAPRPEVIADAAYRLGYDRVLHLDFAVAERYLQQSLAAQSPADTMLNLGTRHALAWLDFLRGRPQAALAQAARFNRAFAAEALLTSVVEKHAWMAGMLKDVARLVVIVEKCQDGKTLTTLYGDPAFARDFSALLPYIPEAYAAECAAPVAGTTTPGVAQALPSPRGDSAGPRSALHAAWSSR